MLGAGLLNCNVSGVTVTCGRPWGRTGVHIKFTVWGLAALDALWLTLSQAIRARSWTSIPGL